MNPALAGTPSPTPTPSPSPTTSPTPAQTATPGPNPAAVARRHAGVLRGRSGAVSFVRTVRTLDGAPVASVRLVGRVDGSRSLFDRRVRVTRPDAWRPVGENRTAWTDGTDSARLVDGERQPVVVDELTPGELRSASGASQVSALFTRWPVAFAGSRETAVGTVAVYTATRSRAAWVGGRTARNLSVQIRVRESGLVERATVRFQTTVRGRRVAVVERFRVTAVGNVTVDRPAWATTGRAIDGVDHRPGPRRE